MGAMHSFLRGLGNTHAEIIGSDNTHAKTVIHMPNRIPHACQAANIHAENVGSCNTHAEETMGSRGTVFVTHRPVHN